MKSSRTVWLGRDRELAELEAGVTDVLSGRGGLFLVTGEPGIGKTRLADEVARSAAGRGVTVHWGRAWEAGGAPSYWPFVQVLRSMCRSLEGASLDGLVRSVARTHGPELAELAVLVPEIRERLPDVLHAPQAPGARERFPFFDAIGSLVHGVASKAPQLVVLDDLHAADPSSLLLLSFLVRDVRAWPLLFVGTYRDAEARLSPELREALARIAREATALPLRRLDRGEIADLVARATGATPDAERVEALHEKSEGIPLFVHELLSLRGSTARAPDGIREVVHARLSLVPSDVREVLGAASVLGRELSTEALAALARMPEDDVDAHLATACDAGIVEPVDGAPSRWRFTHALLREGLYDGLPADRRAELHRAAAIDLARREGDAALAERAHHLMRAIPAVGAAEAAGAAIQAARRATDLLAFEDAGVLLVRAVKALEGARGEERTLFAALLELGLSRIRAADIELGKETCRRAADLARELGDGELFARAVLGSVYEFTPGMRDARTIAMLEEALAMLPPGDGALRARCMVQLAAERQPEPDMREAVALAREAVAMARRVGDADTLRATLGTAGLAMLVFADPRERIAIAEEALRLARDAGDRLFALRSNLLLTAASWELGDMTAAAAHVRAHDALVSEFRHERFRWMPSSLRAATALLEGRFDEAQRWYEEAIALSGEDASRGPTLKAFPLALHRAAERHEAFVDLEARLRGAFGRTQTDLESCIGEMLFAQLHARAGDRARTSAQIAVVRAHPIFGDIREPCWLALLAEPAHLLGDVDLAERLYPVLAPHVSRFHFLGPLGGYVDPPYARELGLLARTLGRLDEAASLLAEADARMVDAGMRAHLARVRIDLASVLLERDGAGDATRAAELLDAARAIAVELGQSRLVTLVDERRRPPAASAPPPRAAERTPSFELRREGEYWTVEAEGRTVRLRDSRGLRVLHMLVSNPGQELHVLQLVSADADAARAAAGDAGAVLDSAAIGTYRRRLLALREELEEAESFSDTGRADRAREEIEFLTRELAHAVGLGGRERRAGGAAERARTAVQKRLREAIRRIEEGIPGLGRHLDQTIRTGTFCGYLPEGRPRARRT